MPAIGTTALTLTDWAKRQDPNGSVARIIEMLNQTNEILDDMLWLEGNLPTGHKTTARTGLPEATWRRLNYGVQKGKSTTAQVIDTCGMLETYAEVDKDLAMLNGNTAEFRLSEDRAFIEGMNQQVAAALLYESEATNPERITGLAPRFSSLSAGNGGNIIDAQGASTDNTSIWLVVWGENTVHGIFPKGSQAGLQNRDLGEQTLSDGNGGQFQGYRSHYQWKPGLSVRDWRYVVRIANIDVSDLAGQTPPDLIRYLIRAYHKIPTVGMGKPAIYCNRAVATWLDIQSLTKANLALRYDEVQGKKVNTFRGIPIRTVDAIKTNEDRVT